MRKSLRILPVIAVMTVTACAQTPTLGGATTIALLPLAIHPNIGYLVPLPIKLVICSFGACNGYAEKNDFPQ